MVVAGAGTVPFAAKVVVLNVTAVAATGPTDIRVYPTPSDDSVPLASNINVVRGQTVPNTVIATVGRDGSVRLRNASGSVQLIVDHSLVLHNSNKLTLRLLPCDVLARVAPVMDAIHAAGIFCNAR